MPFADPLKQQAYKRNWNKQFYSTHKEAEKKRIADRKKEIARWLIEYKKHVVCQRCGESCEECLDFHHLRSDKKDMNIALVNSWGWGRKRIEKEIAKCIIICANCHRKLHAGRLNIEEILRGRLMVGHDALNVGI